MQTGDGRPIPARLKIEIEREWKRLNVVAEQIREIEAERDRLVKGSEPSGDACTEKMRRLVKLHGIGAEFATVLTREVFYRPFQNRRQVASYVGLTPAPMTAETPNATRGSTRPATRGRV
jgi:transposase